METSARDRDGIVTLRGTTQGLEIWIDGPADVGEVVLGIAERLEQSPSFFAGGDVTLRFLGEAPPACLGAIEDVTSRYDLRIVSVRTAALDDDASRDRPQLAVAEDTSAAPDGSALAEGSEPMSTRVEPPVVEPLSAQIESPADSVPVADAPPPPKLIAGPVRSGCVLEVAGHLIVLGDVNPGAEIRAAGSIVILGRLRGIAHAGIEGNPGFILALELEPQQLRIGGLVARAGEDGPGKRAEIAYAKDGQIIVETYRGRIPWGIATAKF